MARSLSPPGTQPVPNPTDMASLGKIVRHRRLVLGLRIDDAAHACGVAASALSRLENGNTVGADKLLQVLSGLGMSMLILGKNKALDVLQSQESKG